MNQMEDNQFTVVDENGNEILCEILFTFHSEETNKSYVLYYPEGTDLDAEDTEIWAASYEENEDGTTGELTDIVSDEEWEMVEEVFHTFLNGEVE